MKTLLYRSAVVLLIATVASPAPAQTPRDPSLTKAQFETITKYIEPGGDLYFIANVDGALEQGVSFLQTLFLTAVQTNVPQVTHALEALPDFLLKNGFYSIHGIGFSTVPRPDGLNDINGFISHAPDAATLPLWRAFTGGETRRLRGLDFVPRTAVMLRTAQAEPGTLWEIFRKAVSDIGGAQADASFNAGLVKLEAGLGASLDQLAASLGDELFVSIQLKDESPISPAMLNPLLAFMDMSVLAGFATKDDTLLEALERKSATGPTPLVRETVGSAVILKPASQGLLPVSFCAASVDGFLLLSSEPATLMAALEAAEKKNGLIDTDRFKQAFEGMPMENHGLAYIEPRFTERLAQIQSQTLAMAPQANPNSAFPKFQELLMARARQQIAAVITKTPDGILIQGVSSTGGREMLASSALAPVGLMAAIAIPSFVKARTTSQKNACINNLRIIDSAKEQWAMAERLQDGDDVDPEGAAQYMRGAKIPKCPSGGTYTLGVIGEDPTCSHKEHSLQRAGAQSSYRPSTAKKPKASAVNSCINNLRIMDSAKEQWAMASRSVDGDVVNPADAADYIKGSTIPLCPGGGTYSLGLIGEPPTCSIPGHVLP